MITSLSNNQVKRVIELLKKSRNRREEGVMVIEGRKMFLEVLSQFPELIEMTFVTEAFLDELAERDGISAESFRYELVSDSVFQKMSETVTPQGVIAIVKTPKHTLDDLLKGDNIKLLILDDLRDPGNMGTIIRTTEAAGFSGILMSKETVDITNPKVVRSTMGAVLRVPCVYVDSLTESIDKIKQTVADFKVYASALDASKPFDQIDYGKHFGIVVGNEANGVSAEVLNKSDMNIHIPMAGKVESLNAAVAAALLMYESR